MFRAIGSIVVYPDTLQCIIDITFEKLLTCSTIPCHVLVASRTRPARAASSTALQDLLFVVKDVKTPREKRTPKRSSTLGRITQRLNKLTTTSPASPCAPRPQVPTRRNNPYNGYDTRSRIPGKRTKPTPQIHPGITLARSL